MKTLKPLKMVFKGLMVLGISAMLVGQSPPATAQGANINGIQVAPYRAKYISQTNTAADTDIAGYVKFFGPGGVTSTTTLDVSAAGTGDLTFVVNGAAYTGFECPVSGALGGVIDVSDAACNTLGEVADIINSTAATFSTGYFRMVLGNALRSDSSNATILADATSTAVATPNGQTLLWDSSVNDDISVGLWDSTIGIQNWIPLGGKKLPSNPFSDTDSVLLYYSENITNAGTITNNEVYCVTEKYKDGGAGSETVRVAYLETAGATTATGKIDEFLNAGGLHCQGGKLVVRVLASGADTSAETVILSGYKAPIAVQ